MSVIINKGIKFSAPSAWDFNWETAYYENLEAMSAHDHSGDGKGVPLSGNSIATGGINGTHILPRNGEWISWRNKNNTGNINGVRVNDQNKLEFGAPVVLSSGQFEITDTLQFNGDDLYLLSSTTDGDDHAEFVVTSHSERVKKVSRAGYLAVSGNEHTDKGSVSLICGDTAQATATLGSEGNQPARLRTAGLDRFEVDINGDLVPLDSNYSVGSPSKKLKEVHSAAYKGLTMASWSPTYGFSAGGGSWSVSILSSDCSYAELGNQVTCRMHFVYQAIGTAGTLISATLPKTAKAYGGAGSGDMLGAGGTHYGAKCSILADGANIYIARSTGLAMETLSSVRVIVTFTYEAS